jgi:hypothetical protein
MALTTAQLTTLKAAILAEPSLATAVSIRNDAEIDTWCNADSTQDAWMTAVDKRTLFEAMDVTKFDGLTAGKRDAWRLLLDNVPIDFTRNKNRKAVTDIWGNTDNSPVLASLVRKATNAEKALGGTGATEGTVTAWKLNWAGTVTRMEVSAALNLA